MLENSIYYCHYCPTCYVKMNMKKLFIFFVISLAASISIAEDAINMELSRLVAEDQSERRMFVKGEKLPDMAEHDAARREKVLTMLADGRIRTSKDFENASWIMQHGTTSEDYQLAYAFATLAAKMDQDNRSARWLTAATFDRMLRSRGKPQWYGTQYQIIGENQLELEPIDESAVSDEERLEKGLSTVSSIEKKGVLK